jgi:hypothetical protein
VASPLGAMDYCKRVKVTYYHTSVAGSTLRMLCTTEFLVLTSMLAISYDISELILLNLLDRVTPLAEITRLCYLNLLWMAKAADPNVTPNAVISEKIDNPSNNQ